MPPSQKRMLLPSLLQLFQPLDQHPMRTHAAGPAGKSQRERKTARTGGSLRPCEPALPGGIANQGQAGGRCVGPGKRRGCARRGEGGAGPPRGISTARGDARPPPAPRRASSSSPGNTNTQPVPRGGRRQPPPWPGEGKLRHGTITATARDTGRRRGESPGDGAAPAPSGVSPRSPERPESPRTGQIRATRSPDRGSSLRLRPRPLSLGRRDPGAR